MELAFIDEDDMNIRQKFSMRTLRLFEELWYDQLRAWIVARRCP